MRRDEGPVGPLRLRFFVLFVFFVANTSWPKFQGQGLLKTQTAFTVRIENCDTSLDTPGMVESTSRCTSS